MQFERFTVALVRADGKAELLPLMFSDLAAAREHAEYCRAHYLGPQPHVNYAER